MNLPQQSSEEEIVGGIGFDFADTAISATFVTGDGMDKCLSGVIRFMSDFDKKVIANWRL